MSKNTDKFSELEPRKRLQILPQPLRRYSPFNYLPHFFQDNPYYYYIKVFYVKMFDSMLRNTYIAPLDRIRTLLQVQHVRKNILPKQRYEGLRDCLNKIPKEQGVRSFWRGNLTHSISVIPYTLATFGLKKTLSDVIVKAKKNQPITLLLQNMLSSFLLGASQLFVLYPFFFVKIRLQSDVWKTPNNREFRGIYDCVKKIYMTEGVQSFYRGFTVSLIGVSINFVLLLGVYGNVIALMLINGNNPSSIFKFWFASVVLFVSKILCYPFLTMRKRIMVQQGTSQKLFNSGIECYKWTMKNEGLRGFYRGFLPHLMVSYYPSVLILLITTQEVINRRYLKE
eukprot:403362682